MPHSCGLCLEIKKGGDAPARAFSVVSLHSPTSQIENWLACPGWVGWLKCRWCRRTQRQQINLHLAARPIPTAIVMYEVWRAA